MSRPDTHGFQKPLDSGKRKPVGMAILKTSDTGVVECTCGWRYIHHREKVRDDAIDKHISRKHGEMGIRL